MNGGARQQQHSRIGGMTIRIGDTNVRIGDTTTRIGEATSRIGDTHMLATAHMIERRTCRMFD